MFDPELIIITFLFGECTLWLLYWPFSSWNKSPYSLTIASCLYLSLFDTVV